MYDRNCRQRDYSFRYNHIILCNSNNAICNICLTNIQEESYFAVEFFIRKTLMQIMFLYQIDEVVTGNRIHFGKVWPVGFSCTYTNRNSLAIEVYHSSYSSLLYGNTLSMYKMPLSMAHCVSDLHLNIQTYNNMISTTKK